MELKEITAGDIIILFGVVFLLGIVAIFYFNPNFVKQFSQSEKSQNQDFNRYFNPDDSKQFDSPRYIENPNQFNSWAKINGISFNEKNNFLLKNGIGIKFTNLLNGLKIDINSQDLNLSSTGDSNNTNFLNGFDSNHFWAINDIRQAQSDWQLLGQNNVGDVNIDDTTFVDGEQHKRLNFFSIDPEFFNTTNAYIEYQGGDYSASTLTLASQSNSEHLNLIGNIERNLVNGGIIFSSATRLEFGDGTAYPSGDAAIYMDTDDGYLLFEQRYTLNLLSRLKGFIFNANKQDTNFQINGKTNSSLFFCNAVLGNCGIKQSQPIVNWDVNGTSKYRKDANFDENLSIGWSTNYPKTNNCVGLTSLVAGTATVTTGCADGNYMVLYAVQGQGGTIGTVEMSAKNTGNFVLLSNNILDTSSVYWEIKHIR